MDRWSGRNHKARGARQRSRPHRSRRAPHSLQDTGNQHTWHGNLRVQAEAESFTVNNLYLNMLHDEGFRKWKDEHLPGAVPQLARYTQFGQPNDTDPAILSSTLDEVGIPTHHRVVSTYGDRWAACFSLWNPPYPRDVQTLSSMFRRLDLGAGPGNAHSEESDCGASSSTLTSDRAMTPYSSAGLIMKPTPVSPTSSTPQSGFTWPSTLTVPAFSNCEPLQATVRFVLPFNSQEAQDFLE